MEPYRVNILFVGPQKWKIFAENEFFLAMEKLCGMETWNCRRVRFKRQYADRTIVIGGRGKCLPEKRIEFISEALNGRLSGDEERIWRNKFDLLIIVADANAIVNKNVEGAEMRSIIATCRFAMHNARSGDDELLVLKMPKEICRLQDKSVEGMRLRIALAKALCGKEDNIVGVSKWFVDAWNSISPLEYLAQYKDRLFTNSGKRVPFFPSLMFLLEDSLAPGYIEILSEIINRCYKKDKLQLNLKNGIFNLNKVIEMKNKTIRLAIVGIPATGKTYFLQDVYGVITDNLEYETCAHIRDGVLDLAGIDGQTHNLLGEVDKTSVLESRNIYEGIFDRKDHTVFSDFNLYTMNIAGEIFKKYEIDPNNPDKSYETEYYRLLSDCLLWLNSKGESIRLKMEKDGNLKKISSITDKKNNKYYKLERHNVEKNDPDQYGYWYDVVSDESSDSQKENKGIARLFKKCISWFSGTNLKKIIKDSRNDYDLEELVAIIHQFRNGDNYGLGESVVKTVIKCMLFVLRATDIVLCDRLLAQYEEGNDIVPILPITSIEGGLNQLIRNKEYPSYKARKYFIYRGADGLISQNWINDKFVNVRRDDSICDSIYENFLIELNEYFRDNGNVVMGMNVINDMEFTDNSSAADKKSPTTDKNNSTANTNGSTTAGDSSAADNNSISDGNSSTTYKVIPSPKRDNKILLQNLHTRINVLDREDLIRKVREDHIYFSSSPILRDARICRLDNSKVFSRDSLVKELNDVFSDKGLKVNVSEKIDKNKKTYEENDIRELLKGYEKDNVISNEQNKEIYKILLSRLKGGNRFSGDEPRLRMRFGTHQFVVGMLTRHKLCNNYRYGNNKTIKEINTTQR